MKNTIEGRRRGAGLAVIAAIAATGPPLAATPVHAETRQPAQVQAQLPADPQPAVTPPSDPQPAGSQPAGPEKPAGPVQPAGSPPAGPVQPAGPETSAGKIDTVGESAASTATGGQVTWSWNMGDFGGADTGTGKVVIHLGEGMEIRKLPTGCTVTGNTVTCSYDARTAGRQPGTIEVAAPAGAEKSVQVSSQMQWHQGVRQGTQSSGVSVQSTGS